MELKDYKDYIDIQLTEDVSQSIPFMQYPFIGKNYRKSQQKVFLVGKSGYNHGKNDKEKEKIQSNYENIKIMHIHGTLYNGLRVKDWCLDSNGNFEKHNEKQKFNQGVEKIFFRDNDIYSRSFDSKRDKFWKSIVHFQLIPRLMPSSPHYELENEPKTAIEILLKMVEVLEAKQVVLMSNDNSYEKILSQILNTNSKIEGKDKVWGSCDNSNIWSTEFKLNNGKSFNFIQLLHPSYRKYKEKYSEYQNDLLQKVMPNFLEYLNGKE